MEFETDPLCCGCGCALTSNNNSEAHIIPNALGGRLKPKGIFCAVCNTELDELADNPLVEAFEAWPTLLDPPRDRGRNPPKTVVSETGLRVRVEIEGPYTVQDVQYEKQPPDGGAAKVSISARRDRSAEFCIDPTVFDAQAWSTAGCASGERDRLAAHYQRAITDLLAHMISSEEAFF